MCHIFEQHIATVHKEVTLHLKDALRQAIFRLHNKLCNELYSLTPTTIQTFHKQRSRQLRDHQKKKDAMLWLLEQKEKESQWLLEAEELKEDLQFLEEEEEEETQRFLDENKVEALKSQEEADTMD